MKQRLLKRIKSWEEAGAVSTTEVDATEVMESLCDDLEKLFNTRRGTVLIDTEFGLPDFTHLRVGYGAPDVDDIERNLLQQLRNYEKRLKSPALQYQQPENNAGGLMFVLSAAFEHKKQDINITANVLFNDDGSVSVSL